MPSKQKSGLYRSKVKIGVDAQGKDVFKWISGKTKRELEDTRREVEEYYISGTGLRGDRLFGEYAEEWYRVRKEPFISASSKNAYRSMLNKHLLPAFGDRNLRSVRFSDLQLFVNQFAGSSSSHIAVLMATVTGVFAAALSEHYLSQSPAIGLRRPEIKPADEKRALTEDERTACVRVCAQHKHGLYLAVMYYLGLRPGEARGLKWGDVDFENDTVHVQRDIDYAAGGKEGALKTASSDRIIPIPYELRVLLARLRGLPNAFLFVGETSGKPLSPATAARRWVYLMDDCGLTAPISKDEELHYARNDVRAKRRAVVTPHAMRHNFITMCWENGLDVLITMKLVGHADYQTTMNIYTHLSESSMEKAKVQLDEMFASNPVKRRENKSCTKVAQTE
ncbi:MAG: site-specific integrase [Clostridia bacterium]